MNKMLTLREQISGLVIDKAEGVLDYNQLVEGLLTLFDTTIEEVLGEIDNQKDGTMVDLLWRGARQEFRAEARARYKEKRG